MMRYLALLLAFFFIGCTTNKEVRVESIDEIVPVEISNTGVDIQFAVTLSNTFKGKVTLKSGWAEVLNNGKIVARIDLSEKVIISAASTQPYIIPVRVRIGQKNLSQIAELFINETKWSIRGELLAKKGVIGKKIKFEQQIAKSDLDKIAPLLNSF